MVQGGHIELYTSDGILPQCHVDVMVGQMIVDAGAGVECGQLEVCQRRIRASFSGSLSRGRAVLYVAD